MSEVFLVFFFFLFSLDCAFYFNQGHKPSTIFITICWKSNNTTYTIATTTAAARVATKARATTITTTATTTNRKAATAGSS